MDQRVLKAFWGQDASVLSERRNSGGERYVFLPLPSPRAGRWWVPVKDSRVVPNALSSYTPYSLAGRLAKAATETLLQMPGAARLFPGRSVVVLDTPSPVLDVLRQVYQRQELTFSFSVGSPGRFQRLIVQVMGSTGTVLGYLKLPLTEDAERRIRNEARTLLSLPGGLARHVPDVLFSSEVNGSSTLLLRPGPFKRGPRTLSCMHMDFLRKVHRIEHREEDGETFVERIKRRASTSVLLTTEPWRAAVDWATRRLTGKRVAVSRVHGDFAPWNTRITQEGLFAFDWDRSEEGLPMVWDVLHFQTQVSSLLGSKWKPERLQAFYPETSQEVLEGLLALYLVDSAGAVVIEKPDLKKALGFRRTAVEELTR